VLTLGFSGRIRVAVESADGRKGIDSLSGVVRSVLQGDPLSGDLFVFRNRSGDKLKILAWMGDAGLKTASVLLSVCASATRHRLNPWAYLRDVLDQLSARSAGSDVGGSSPRCLGHPARPAKLTELPSPPKV
jgi:transposase